MICSNRTALVANPKMYPNSDNLSFVSCSVVNILAKQPTIDMFINEYEIFQCWRC